MSAMRRAAAVVELLLYALAELVLSNLTVARDVLAPKGRVKPRVVRVPLQMHSPLGITVLAQLVTLTPGTLAVEISAERNALYVHVMNAANVEAVRRQVQEGFARRVRKVLP